MLGDHWKEIEEYRILQTQKRIFLAKQANPVSTPELKGESEEEDGEIHLAQDDSVANKKQKGVAINSTFTKLNSSINSHYFGKLLFTKLKIANLGGREIEALVVTGCSTSLLRKGLLPDSHMETVEEPLVGLGANDNQFQMNRKTRSVLIQTKDNLHKLQLWELENLGVSEAILGIYFLQSFDECNITFSPETQTNGAPSIYKKTQIRVRHYESW